MEVAVEGLDVVLTNKFVGFCCEQLDIKPSLITIYGWERLENNALGLCYQVDIDEYMIMVSTEDRNLTEIYNTIAHEMIHVKQYMKQGLKELCQDAYKPIYKQQWWEQEASEKSVILVKKYVDILYNMV